jgi:hypothetical protein
MNRGMPNKPSSSTVSSGIQLEYFMLVKVDTELLQPLPGDDEVLPGDAQLGVSAVRHPVERTRLRVEIEYNVSGEHLNLLIVYRMGFVQIGEEPEDIDAFWRRMVARYAPGITMPYVREMVHTITGKMGSRGFLIPVLNYDSVFRPDDIEIGVHADESRGIDSGGERAKRTPKRATKSRGKKA